MKTYSEGTQGNWLRVIAVVIAVSLLLLLLPSPVTALITKQSQSVEMQGFTNYEFFDTSSSTTIPYALGTTTSATSTDVTYIDSSGRVDNGYMVIGAAEEVSVYFGRSTGGGNSGTSTFRIQISDDGSNWYDYNKLISNVTNTNAQTVTRVASVALTGTSTAMVSLDPDDAIYAIRCIVVEATDGTHRCRASARN